MAVIRFNAAQNDRIEEFLDAFPETDGLTAPQLEALKDQVTELIAQLDAAEPRSQQSEAYEQWAEKHEDLEDVLDEILDALDEL